MGTWIDIYDRSAWAAPRRSVAAMAAEGVRTLYLQTSNDNRHDAFVFEDGVRRFLDAADAVDIKVVAWYLPGLWDVDLDERRSVRAIRFTTDKGNAFDGFGLDIESSDIPDPAVRTSRLLDLSDRIRSAAGEDYPLAAIVPSPRRILVTDTDYWPGFPFGSLASTYDVTMPMTYFSYRVSGCTGAHWYTTQAVELIREQVGTDEVPLHVIGGISGDATTPEARCFTEALRERGALGGSFYDFPGVSSAQWSELRAIRPNLPQSPGLPVPPGVAELGNVPGGDVTHPAEVVYRVGGKPGAWRISFEAFDVQKAEIGIYVNWHLLATIAPGDADSWTEPRHRDIPDAWLRDAGANYFAFVADGTDPDWSVWGVRNVDVSPAA